MGRNLTSYRWRCKMVETISRMTLQLLMKLSMSFTWALPFYLLLGLLHCLPSMAHGTIKTKMEIPGSRWTVLSTAHSHSTPQQNGHVDEGRAGTYWDMLWAPFTDSPLSFFNLWDNTEVIPAGCQHDHQPSGGLRDPVFLLHNVFLDLVQLCKLAPL